MLRFGRDGVVLREISLFFISIKNVGSGGIQMVAATEIPITANSVCNPQGG